MYVHILVHTILYDDDAVVSQEIHLVEPVIQDGDDSYTGMDHMISRDSVSYSTHTKRMSFLYCKVNGSRKNVKCRHYMVSSAICYWYVSVCV